MESFTLKSKKFAAPIGAAKPFKNSYLFLIFAPEKRFFDKEVIFQKKFRGAYRRRQTFKVGTFFKYMRQKMLIFLLKTRSK